MTEAVGPASWYVQTDEVRAYEEAGATRVVPTEAGVAKARNAALDEADVLTPEEADARDGRHLAALPCVQLSDDLVRFKIKTGEDWETCPTDDALGEMMIRLHRGYTLVGLPPTANTFFAGRDAGTLFIVGDCIVVEPSPIRFDENLRLKEDYDLTLQHIQQGSISRLAHVVAEFKHYKNPGGAVDYRTTRIERETMRYLMKKWPGWIHKHPRRQNEIMLRVPTKKSVL